MSVSSQELKPKPRGRGVLLAGVAAAALMGVGLGLWARPAMSERKLALAPIEALKSQPARLLQIVIDDAPAPLGAPIEVLPDRPAPLRVEPPRHLPPELVAPVRPATGLVRVQSVERNRPPTGKAAPKPVRAEPQASRPAKTKSVAAAKPKLSPVKVAAINPIAKARSRPAKAIGKTQMAKTQMAKAAPLKPQRIKAVRPAASRVEGPPRAKKIQTPKLLKAPAVKTVKVARVDRGLVRAAAHKPANSVKATKTRDARKIVPATKAPAAKVSVRRQPPKMLKPARGAGPIRVAKAAPRPDPTLRDADRQMNRAYSTARAAGVPDWQLRRQQARWEAARSSAAKEAPWAVHDVYLARIAELHDLTRDAQGPGY